MGSPSLDRKTTPPGPERCGPSMSMESGVDLRGCNRSVPPNLKSNSLFSTDSFKPDAVSQISFIFKNGTLF